MKKLVRNFLKTILLAFAILIAVVCVMWYYKTIVTPPEILSFKNQFVNSDKIGISKVKSCNTDLAMDSVFVAITHELDFQLSNSLLTGEERDELLKDFVDQYVPLFKTACNVKFNKSVWDEKDLKRIDSRVSELQSLVTADRKSVIQREANESLNEVHDVIVNYNEAKTAALVSAKYEGLQYAKRKIANAKKYASMSPINNCSELVNLLNNVPERLEYLHYSYLVSQVERLKDYQLFSETDFENLASSISKELDEYKVNAKSTYGKATSITLLENRAGNYYSNATEYYHPTKSSD